MKIRVKYSNSQKFIITLPQPEPSLINLKDSVSKFISENYGENNLVLEFSLNGKDPIVGLESDSLASFGIVNNDLLTVLQDYPNKDNHSIKDSFSSTVTNQSSSSTLQQSSSSANTCFPLNSSTENMSNKNVPFSMDPANVSSLEIISGSSACCSDNKASKVTNLLEAKDGEPPTAVVEAFEQYSPSTASQVLTLLTHIAMLENGFFVQDGENSFLKTLPISWKEMVSTIPYHHPGFNKFDCAIVLVTMGNVKQVLASFEGQESEISIKFDLNDYLQNNEILPQKLTKLSHFAKILRNKLLYPLQVAAHETLGVPAPWHLAGLPQEMLIKIVCYLDLKSILNLSSSCKRLLATCKDNKLWFIIFKRDFPNHSHSSDMVSGADWKAKYLTIRDRTKSEALKKEKEVNYVLPNVPYGPRHIYPNPYQPPFLPQPRVPNPIYPPQPDLPNGPFWDPDNPFFGGDIPVNPMPEFPYGPHPFNDPFRIRPRRPYNPLEPTFGPPGFNPNFGPRYL